jgi:pimeloyl-ACP methyl ester carboxylesterase
MVIPSECTFSVNGRTMAARCWHDSNKPPLLALHGWLDNAASFDLLAPLLNDFHIVALDFAGHGWSEHRAIGTRYHNLDHVDDVLSVVNQLGWQQFTLMGHSMGAGVASLLASALPERVTKLVMIEGFGPYTGKVEEAAKYLRTALLEWQEFSDKPRLIANIEIAVQARINGLLPVSEQAARLLCARGVKVVEGGLMWTADKRLRLSSPSRLNEEQVCAFLAAINVPTLLIVAEKSLPFNPQDYAARVAAHPHLTVVKLAGGHHLHLDDNVDGVFQTIKTFL